MNAETMMVDPNELVIDMPLDEANVNTKVESMRNNGMIQDVTVWLQDMRIIDGFHRTEAARRLGLPAIRCKVVDCSEAAFWDARIQSARQHHTIEGERLQVWIRECWRNSDWPDVIALMKDGQLRASNPNVIDAYMANRNEMCVIKPQNRFERWLVEDCGLAYWYELSTISDDAMRKVKGLGPERRAKFRAQQKRAEEILSLNNANPLSALSRKWTEEDEALTVAIFLASDMNNTKGDLSVSLGAWFKDKATQWGISIDWLVNLVFSELVDTREIAKGCDILRGAVENYTIGDAAALAVALPIDGYYLTSDTENEMKQYISDRNRGETWEHYRKRARDADYLERKARAESEALRQKAWAESEAGKEAERREKEKSVRDSIRQNIEYARACVSRCNTIDIKSVPDAPALLAEYAQFVADFAAEHFPDVQIAQPNPVALENSRLRSENAKLKERIASLERALGSKQAAGEMLSSAMAWSSEDMR